VVFIGLKIIFYFGSRNFDFGFILGIAPIILGDYTDLGMITPNYLKILSSEARQPHAVHNR